jgi:hypothetical protein
VTAEEECVKFHDLCVCVMGGGVGAVGGRVSVGAGYVLAATSQADAAVLSLL